MIIIIIILIVIVWPLFNPCLLLLLVGKNKINNSHPANASFMTVYIWLDKKKIENRK